MEADVDNARAKKRALQVTQKPRARIYANGMVCIVSQSSTKVMQCSDWLKAENEQVKQQLQLLKNQQWQMMKRRWAMLNLCDWIMARPNVS